MELKEKLNGLISEVMSRSSDLRNWTEGVLNKV